LRPALAECENLIEASGGIERGEIDRQTLWAEIETHLGKIDNDDQHHRPHEQRGQCARCAAETEHHLRADALGAQIGE